MDKPNRNYGIDLLRIVFMLGVILLGHGGALAAKPEAPIKRMVGILAAGR